MQELIDILGLNLYGEPEITYLKILLFATVIMSIINLTIKTVNNSKRFLNKPISLGIIIVISIGLFLLLKYEKNLEIVTFEAQQAQYDIDEDIWINVQTNKKVYAYLYTYNDEGTRKLLYPKKLTDEHILPANKLVEIGSFNVKDSSKKIYKDETVCLIVSIHPLKSAKKEMTHQSFTKMLGGNKNTGMNIINGKPDQKDLNITIPIRKPTQKVTIETQSNAYKQGEDIDLDINSLNDGYVWVFEATPTDNITKLNSGKIDKNRRFPTGTVGKSPNGYHTAVAIYTKENTPLGVDDFTIVKGETIKGEPTFEVKFKNGKNYTYNIETFEVTH